MLRTRGWLMAFALSVGAACGGGEADRLFPPLDEHDAGSVPDASDDATVDAGDDAPSDADVDADVDANDGSDSVECESATDCPPLDEPCMLPVCATGACTAAHAPAGTEVAEHVQIPGDCKRLECGENGSLVAKTDTDDTPPDDDCFRTFCDGPNPRTENLPVGTPCVGNGVCNGQGRCGSCVPGAKGCNGKVPHQCDEEGKWRTRPVCAGECKAGECVD